MAEVRQLEKYTINRSKSAFMCVISIIVLLSLLSPPFVDAQIHRSHDSKKWQRSKNIKLGLEDTMNNEDADFDFNSRLGKNMRLDNVVNVAVDETYSRQKIWTYSLLSSVLIGMCGVFPLIVIPMGAGPAQSEGVGSSKLKLLLSFAVGSLLGDVFLHLLPEAWAHARSHLDHFNIGLLVLSGIVFFLALEKVFGEEESVEEDDNADNEFVIQKLLEENGVDRKHTFLDKHHNNNHESNCISHDKFTTKTSLLKNGIVKRTKRAIDKSDECNGNPDKFSNKHSESNGTIVLENNNITCKLDTQNKNDAAKPSENKHSPIKVSGYLNLLANCIDNFTHGLAIGGSYVISAKMGLLTTFAILIHEIPHEISDFAILLNSGFNRIRAAKAQVMTAFGGIVGVVCVLTAESAESAGNSTAWILPFTSGGFLYIALVTVTPDLLQEKSLRESVKQVLGICGGISAMMLVTVVMG